MIFGLRQSVLILVAKKEIDFSRVHFSLAGSGDPWSSLTKLRVQIMKELLDGTDLSELASELDLTLEKLKVEIQPLQDASLVWESNGKLKPSFLICDFDETQLVYNDACVFSKNLADTLEDHFDDIKDSYRNLDVSKEWDFEKLAFLLVGGCIIDIKLLEKLTTGSRLLPPAPPRPSPERPDAHYYFWMIEGEKKHLGEYGLDDYDLPWPSWRYFSFGQNLINSKPNPDREQMETKYRELVETKSVESPEALGEELGIPIMPPSDSKKFAETSDKYAELLSLSYMEQEQSIFELHSDLKSGKHAPHSFGEFFCWYAHIAYSVAIDTLESNGVLPVPPERFQSAIWYREQDREGLLTGL